MPHNLALTLEQQLLRDTFTELFATESSPERVRRAEESGFDAELWRRLAEIGALGIRVPEQRGGSGLGLLEATILLDEVAMHFEVARVLSWRSHWVAAEGRPTLAKDRVEASAYCQ